MREKYSNTELGIRASDWESVCKKRLHNRDWINIQDEVRQIAIDRNKIQNEQSDRLMTSGSCASHRD